MIFRFDTHLAHALFDKPHGYEQKQLTSLHTKIMFHTSPISRIALAQSLVVFIGVMTTCGMLKLHDYDPQSGTRWNP